MISPFFEFSPLDALGDPSSGLAVFDLAYHDVSARGTSFFDRHYSSRQP